MLKIICILSIHQCAKKIRAAQTVLEAKREEFVDDALIYTKSLCEELEISFEPPRRVRRKHIIGDGSKDVQLSYEDDLRRTMFSIHRVTAEIQQRFQQLQNLAQKYVFLRPEVILSLDELNLDQAHQDINKEEFQLEREWILLQKAGIVLNLKHQNWFLCDTHRQIYDFVKEVIIQEVQSRPDLEENTCLLHKDKVKCLIPEEKRNKLSEFRNLYGTVFESGGDLSSFIECHINPGNNPPFFGASQTSNV
ncbi:UNVERIFIED_CONTAM: hypothetical protein NCL1_57192 [Trichonephila clavipes]